MVNIREKLDFLRFNDRPKIPISYNASGEITPQTYDALVKEIRELGITGVDFLCSVGVNPDCLDDNQLAQLLPFLPLLRDGILKSLTVTAAGSLQRTNEERKYLTLVQKIAFQISKIAESISDKDKTADKNNKPTDSDLKRSIQAFKKAIAELKDIENSEASTDRVQVKFLISKIKNFLAVLLRDEKFLALNRNREALGKINEILLFFDFFVLKEALERTTKEENSFISRTLINLTEAGMLEQYKVPSIPINPWSDYVGFGTQVALMVQRLDRLRELENEPPYTPEQKLRLEKLCKETVADLEEHAKKLKQRRGMSTETKPYNVEQDLADIAALKEDAVLQKAIAVTTKKNLSVKEHGQQLTREETLTSKVGFPSQYLQEGSDRYSAEEVQKYFSVKRHERTAVVYPGAPTEAISAGLHLEKDRNEPEAIFVHAALVKKPNPDSQIDRGTTSNPINIGNERQRDCYDLQGGFSGSPSSDGGSSSTASTVRMSSAGPSPDDALQPSTDTPSLPSDMPQLPTAWLSNNDPPMASGQKKTHDRMPRDRKLEALPPAPSRSGSLGSITTVTNDDSEEDVQPTRRRTFEFSKDKRGKEMLRVAQLQAGANFARPPILTYEKPGGDKIHVHRIPTDKEGREFLASLFHPQMAQAPEPKARPGSPAPGDK